MDVIVSIFAVLVGLGCLYAIFRSDKKDLEKGSETEEKK